MSARDRLRRCAFRVAAIAAGCCLLLPRQAGAAGEPFFVELIEGRDLVVVAFEDGLVRRLSFPDLEPAGELDVGAGLEAVAVARNGKWLAAGLHGGDLEVRELDTGLLRFSIPGPPSGGKRSFLFHPLEDVLLLFQEGRLQLWDVERGAATETLRGIRAAQRMSISPDGRFLAVAGRCRTGCGDFGLCVVNLEERLVLGGRMGVYDGAAADWVADLAYTARHRIAITEANAGGTRLFYAGTLTGGGFLSGSYPARAAIRSAPKNQREHQSLDEEWRVTLAEDGTHLSLYRLEPGEGPRRPYDLVKRVALP